MINLIQPITVQQAYDGITHARWWASWNWWWRMVDDDDDDRFPSLEPQTDIRSTLPRGFRAWRWLRIIKRDESFFTYFFLRKRKYMELELRSVDVQVAKEAGAPPRGGGAPPTSRDQGVGPLPLILSPVFFINSEKCLCGFAGHSENFYFCTKITPWQFC